MCRKRFGFAKFRQGRDCPKGFRRQSFVICHCEQYKSYKSMDVAFLLSNLLLLVCAMLHGLRALQVGGLCAGARVFEILDSFRG